MSSAAATLRHWARRLLDPDAALAQVFEAFLELLEHDGRAHEHMAELAGLCLGAPPEDRQRTLARYQHLADEVRAMIACLERMAPAAARQPAAYFRKFDFYIRFLMAGPECPRLPPHALVLADLPDPSMAGAKAANLARLAAAGLPVPRGFATSVSAFHHFMAETGLRDEVDALLAATDPRDHGTLERLERRAGEAIQAAPLPPRLARAMDEAWEEAFAGENPRVAVRSSALAEDGDLSFAGLYASVLEVEREGLERAWRQVLASKYTPQAVSYRVRAGLDDEDCAMAVLVMEMVPARCAGVMHSRDARHGGRLLLRAVEGLGEPLVAGRRRGAAYGLERRAGGGEPLLAESPPGGGPLEPEEARGLAALALRAETLLDMGPLDLEWALDHQGRPFLLQARPLPREGLAVSRGQGEGGPAAGKEAGQPRETARGAPAGPPLFRGGERAAGGLGHGRVAHAGAGADLADLPGQTVLVCQDIPPEYCGHMDRLAAVLAARGDAASHFAILCREAGLPLLVGCGPEVFALEPGTRVTVDAWAGTVHAGGTAPARAETRDKARDCPGRLRAMLDFITPLRLTDPHAPDFKAASCRSLHDIVRFCHETAIRTVFSLGNGLGPRNRGVRLLRTRLPLDMHVTALDRELPGPGPLDARQCGSPLLEALVRGLEDPDIDWGERSHFDWKTFDDLVLAGAVSAGSQLASYGLLAEHYLNINIRFGYHFTVLDALASPAARKNFCNLRFAGGGADLEGRLLRLDFVEAVLRELGFATRRGGDMLDARLAPAEAERITAALEHCGRLLGLSCLLDMRLRDSAQVRELTGAFLARARLAGRPGLAAVPEPASGPGSASHSNPHVRR